MQVTDARAVIAIGLSGQFGLRGRLPWEGNRGREYVADVERFFDLTRGHVLIMGHRTFTSVPDFAFQNRDIVVEAQATRLLPAGFKEVDVGSEPNDFPNRPIVWPRARSFRRCAAVPMSFTPPLLF
jgi:dihydrofolate reductase